MKLSVFIPCYNEGENLPILIPLVAKTMKSLLNPYEIIIVNDGSTDNTMGIATTLTKTYKNLKVFNHPYNQGLTQAFVTFFENTSGDIIFFIPGDLQSNPKEDIPKLFEKINSGYDLVVGWRKNRKGFKKYASIIYNLLSRILFGIKIHDSNWIKAFKRKVVVDLQLRSEWHRYIPMLVASKGYKVGEIPVKEYKRQHGISKFGSKRLLTGLLDLIVVKFQISFMEKPMQFFGSTGLLLLLIGFLGGSYLLAIRVVFGTIADRMPLLFLVVLLILLGIQLFALGFLSEQVAAIKR